MRIAMLVPGLAPHDAVSNDTLGMTRALRAQGHEVVVFAPHARGVDEPIRAPAEIESWLQSPADAIVYHYCVGWDFALALFGRTRARRVLRYHNITPPEFFAEWSDGYVAACAEGRGQLDAYAALNCELYLGCSPYNLDDFLARGVDPRRCALLPPFHEVEQLRSLAPSAGRLPRGEPLLLMVGRLAPNKAHVDLIDALAALRAMGADAAHLLSAGKLDPNLSRYGEALEQHLHRRDVEDAVTLMQDANGAELRAAYERADALVMLSRHEGFCVPLIEAMALGTPVIARASSAIPWTLGEAGLLFDEADPHTIAAAVLRVQRDAALREHLRAAGRARYASTFAPAVLERDLATALTQVAAR
ncbi:glycosyltransferase family 4 protein [Dokdonella sp.]|uniref:glycosyltransferase family 4 protein n=1 Tax=Dokdonella sp. TaxID=2291710 RepID=UPI001B1F48D7|nr:glycosyltransferase family 4 protein [Dokdonella sp.]MBO9661405.1 glycosyltransferase family 4 protein [Dokdonella sp.]